MSDISVGFSDLSVEDYSVDLSDISVGFSDLSVEDYSVDLSDLPELANVVAYLLSWAR